MASATSNINQYVELVVSRYLVLECIIAELSSLLPPASPSRPELAVGENQLRSAIWSEISILKDHHHHHHSYLGNSPIEGWVRLTWLLSSRRRGLKGIIILRNNLVYIEMVLKEQSIIRTSVNSKCRPPCILDGQAKNLIIYFLFYKVEGQMPIYLF